MASLPSVAVSGNIKLDQEFRKHPTSSISSEKVLLYTLVQSFFPFTSVVGLHVLFKILSSVCLFEF